MTKRVQGVQNDPRRKVRFKEQAREIVAVDRYNRRYGKSVDTAGAIAQALERAYREGVLDGRNGFRWLRKARAPWLWRCDDGGGSSMPETLGTRRPR